MRKEKKYSQFKQTQRFAKKSQGNAEKGEIDISQQNVLRLLKNIPENCREG